MRPFACLTVPTALAAVAAATVARAQPGRDFDPANEGWNGTSRFVAIARAEGIDLEIPDRVDVGLLEPADALIVLAPAQDLPAAALVDFMRAGGRVALADDFGRGDSLLRAFRIGRGRPSRGEAMRLRGNDELLVAHPSTAHPLSAGVGAIVTNHPQVVYHHELSPIFAFARVEGTARDAVVLAGAVGHGRFVAIGDPSVLINNMLELGGNRRFAQNLFTYLVGSEGGRLILAPPGTAIVGRFGEPGAGRPLHELRALLERLAAARLPPAAMRVAAAALAGILLMLAAGILPRSSPYASATAFAPPGANGGFVGRIEWFARRPANLAEAALAYQEEFEAELRDALGMREPARRIGIAEAVAAMNARGASAEEVAAARAVLGELAQLRDDLERGARSDALPATQLRRIVERGDAVLARIRAGRQRSGAAT